MAARVGGLCDLGDNTRKLLGLCDQVPNNSNHHNANIHTCNLYEITFFWINKQLLMLCFGNLCNVYFNLLTRGFLRSTDQIEVPVAKTHKQSLKITLTKSNVIKKLIYKYKL